MNVTCRLCKHSRTLKKVPNGRLCKHANVMTSIDAKACNQFVCDGTFYCPYLKKFTGIRTCRRLAAVQRSNRKPCKSCEYAANADIIELLMECAQTCTLRRR